MGFDFALLCFGHRKHHLKFENFGFEKLEILKTPWADSERIFLYLGINFIISVIIIYESTKYGISDTESILNFSEMILLEILSGIMVVLTLLLWKKYFQGILLRTMCNKAGNIFGSIITAGVFTLLHFPWQSFIPIFILV